MCVGDQFTMNAFMHSIPLYICSASHCSLSLINLTVSLPKTGMTWLFSQLDFSSTIALSLGLSGSVWHLSFLTLWSFMVGFFLHPATVMDVKVGDSISHFPCQPWLQCSGAGSIVSCLQPVLDCMMPFYWVGCHVPISLNLMIMSLSISNLWDATSNSMPYISSAAWCQCR